MRSIYRSIATRHNLWMLGLTLAVLAGWHFGYVSNQDAGLIGFLGITMNTAGARVIDPILSTVAQGYQNAEFIGMNLFPYVPVGQRGGKIITFGKEDFALYATGRAPGANTTELWLAYDYLMLPVKIRHLDPQGESLVQVATEILMSPE